VGQFLFRGSLSVPTDSPPERGPSTPEEREKVIKLVRSLELDPLAPDSPESRQWLFEWASEVPDFFFFECSLLAADNGQPFPYRRELDQQVYFSSMADLVSHPEKVNDQLSVYIAGVEGALRAYRSIVSQHPEAKSNAMEALASSAKNLEPIIHHRVRKRCR
jgi:hypothetical protein